MRSLIRPALFMITRLGLFLSVAVWAVGQWWTIRIDNSQQDVYFSVDGHGWLATNIRSPPHSAGAGWQWSTSPTDGEILNDVLLVSNSFSLFENQVPIAFEAVQGVGYRIGELFTFIAIRHWLVVTNFTLVHFALWCTTESQPR